MSLQLTNPTLVLQVTRLGRIKVWIQGLNARLNARVDGRCNGAGADARVDGGCKGAGADARVDAFTWINT